MLAGDNHPMSMNLIKNFRRKSVIIYIFVGYQINELPLMFKFFELKIYN